MEHDHGKHGDSNHSAEHRHAAPGAEVGVTRDPVCGMKVDRATARYFTRHEDQGLYFCSAGCQRTFTADPDSFLGARTTIEVMGAGTQYTCPTHPEIIRDKPGSCPICGMALEPMGVRTGEEGPNPELVDFTCRL